MQVAQLKRWLWGPLSALGVSVALLTLALDQASKWWVLLVFRLRDDPRTVPVTPFLNFVYVENRGISYGLLQLDSDLGQWLLAGFAGLAVLAMAVWLAWGVTEQLVAAQPRARSWAGRPAMPSTAWFWAAWRTSSSCTPSDSTGTCSISPMQLSLPGSAGSCMNSFVSSRNRAAKSP